MLTELCAEIRNYFVRNPSEDIHEGTYTISGGAISPLDFIAVGQYYRIVGSVFNDGVHKKSVQSDSELTDEVFTGAIWAMAVPPSVVALATEIESYNTANSEAPFVSESFGGYSYTKATDINGNVAGWKQAFASQLNRYRRIHL